MTSQQLPANPWYREPWAWFVLTPLIVVVVVSLSFVAVAVNKADDTVIDNYYKEGRMINLSLAQDKRAANWQIRVKIDWLAATGQLDIELISPVIPAPEALTLWLDHPFDEDQDLSVTAEQVAANRYRATIAETDQHWYLTLQPAGYPGPQPGPLAD